MSETKPEVTSRAEAGLVEEDFEVQPNDEAIAAGEYLVEGSTQFSTPPSQLKISGMSEEEQNMEMTPAIVGPPAYGSPVPETSAGRLLPLDQHPFNPSDLPEDHPARISEDYGVGYQANLTPEQLGSQFPGPPGTDLLTDLRGTEEGGEQSATVQAQEQRESYESMTVADLRAEAESRGLTGLSGATKADLITALQADDANPSPVEGV